MYCKCCTPFSGTWRNRERFVAADTTHGRNALPQNSSVLAVDTVGSEPPRAPNRPARRCVGHGCSSGKVVVEHVRRREVAFGDLWVVGDPCGCRVSRKRLPAVGVAAKVSACQPTSCGRLGCLRICAEHLTLAECETLATEGDATCMRMIAVLDRPRVIGLVDEYWVQRHDNTPVGGRDNTPEAPDSTADGSETTCGETDKRFFANFATLYHRGKSVLTKVTQQ